ncbi:Uncharacterised protein [Chryseobacterium nakagawai]|uniref:Uncharacterized protein n=1 Tax=Chryseobacterium nakagawai TaxID=1241982 RepID=A0AAD1DQW7_CHRNA|nr:hypothetical protein [Chryseobacterium nakagawai]AZA91176.1 hypothetical protein EG343_11310 [Chryseobacterium nakagawai]VEH22740.1 Uncharacterised protein [Chryseobacterium nakagawai]
MGKVIEINSDQLENMAVLSEFADEKQIEIKSAALKDMSCTYTYELLHGLTKGDQLTHKGMHIVHDDMFEAFKQLDVFLAHIDGVFHWANNQTHIDDLEEHEDLEKFNVYSFKITGTDENKSVILSGSKESSIGTITFSTPKVKIGDNGTYLYIQELKDRLDVVIEQVEAYMNGKTAPQYEQLSMDFDASGNDEDFENAKVE